MRFLLHTLNEASVEFMFHDLFLNLSVAEKIGIGLALSDAENTDARMFGELLVYSSFFAPLLVWKLGLHLLVEKAEKKKAREGKELTQLDEQCFRDLIIK
ncbi:hypothetical protein OIU76_011427 [Salix suchowensis]|nr:hypothetical protein IMY05_010G0066500 [Salix suchowensis]KAJ6324127.1 hypothetical protein OIU76_011427 [Salix suchowensis]